MQPALRPDIRPTEPVTNAPPRALLEDLFRTAVDAVHPASCMRRFLPGPPRGGRLIVLAAGKAAGSMAEAAERHYLAEGLMDAAQFTGMAVARHGYGRPTRSTRMIEAGHPIPDDAGLQAAERALLLADGATRDDLVLVLMSGGASANWIAPVTGLTLADKRAVTRELLRCGADIGEMNTLRKHLSRIKGGRLAARAAPARVMTLAISDVPGDDPAVIGSGPTVPDPTTLADARAVVARFRLDLPPAVATALTDPQNESPKPGDAVFANTGFQLVARPADAFDAAIARAAALGYECIFLGERVVGEARDVAAAHAELIRNLRAQKRRALILSGGELTVTIRGRGRGGPNQEYALALAIALEGIPGVAALAADTDGTDGGVGSPEDPAGAYVDSHTATAARQRGVDPETHLADNNSTTFFTAVGGLLTPGPTFTNVNDFRAILVDNS
jgi:hydroxypyruvate reductase